MRRSPQRRRNSPKIPIPSVRRRMTALHHGGRRDGLEIAPNLWAGIGLVRRGAGTALVGDPEDGRGAPARISGARNRDRHRLRLSASRRGLQGRRTPVSGTRDRRSESLQPRHGARRVRRRRVQAGDRRRVILSVGGRRAPPAAAAESSCRPIRKDRMADVVTSLQRPLRTPRFALRLDLKRLLAPAVGWIAPALLVSVWQASASLGWLPNSLLPSPLRRPRGRVAPYAVRRTAAQRRGQFPARLRRPRRRRRDRLRLRPRQRPFAGVRPL